MSITGSWYHAEYAPQDSTGLVGGGIDEAAPFGGTLSELFEAGASPFLGRPSYERYRKLFFKNEGGNDIEDCVAFWADLEHAEQMKFAFEKSTDDTSTNSVTRPAGYDEADFLNPVGLINASGLPSSTIAAGETRAFWIWQELPAGLTAETGALARLAIAGNAL